MEEADLARLDRFWRTSAEQRDGYLVSVPASSCAALFEGLLQPVPSPGGEDR